ncbi:MAG: spermidine/putrescine transport system substrate-binding protein [Gammaproteobacteria bacterium]|jgi:spermidine/putrescine transport system substrate-binding protein
MNDAVKITTDNCRRRFLKISTAAGVGAAVGPWVVSPSVLASSGEINCTIWTDYIPPGVLSDFTKKTGIKVNYKKIGSNEELIGQMKGSKGAGVDLCSPTNNRSGQWADLGLLQPFNYKKITTLGKLNPAMLKVGQTDWNFDGNGSHWLPFVWGTEAIGWRTDIYKPPGGIPSYANIWDPVNEGKTMIRPHSGMLGAGLYMETIGELAPGDVWKGYTGEVEMRRVWDKITRFCIARKSQIKLFWNDADSQKNGLLNEGVVVGQTWDGPVLSMKSEGKLVNYQAPKEGALAWVDGLAMSSAAKNIEQTYELINYLLNAEVAGKSIDNHGSNSAVLGADKYTGPDYRKNFAESYPGGALGNLHPWPAEPQWYADARTEYKNKFVNA